MSKVLSTNPCREVHLETYKGYDIIWCEGIEDDSPFVYAIPEGTYGISESVAEADDIEEVKQAIDQFVVEEAKA